jgi:hypothetical protein
MEGGIRLGQIGPIPIAWAFFDSFSFLTSFSHTHVRARFMLVPLPIPHQLAILATINISPPYTKFNRLI